MAKKKEGETVKVKAKRKPTKVGWVKCHNCGHIWYAKTSKPRCPKCRSWRWDISEPPTEEEKGMEKHDYVETLDVEEQAKAQYLINAGLGKNLNEILKKLIDNEVLKQIKFGGGKTMADIEVTKTKPQEVFDDITTRRALAAEAKKLEAEAEVDVSRAQAEARRIEMVPQLEELKGKAARGEPDALDDMEKLIGRMMKMDMISAYIDKIKGTQQGKPNQEVDTVKLQLQQLQQQLMEDKRTAEIKTAIERQQRDNEELRKIFMENLKAKTGDTQGDLITKMSQIFSDRDKELERMRLEMTKLDRESRDKLLDEKLLRIEEKVVASGGGGKKDIAEVAQDIKAIREVAKEFTVGTEKSKGEMAMDLISGTIEKIKEPILAPVGQAMAESIRTSKQQQMYQSQPYPPQPVASGQTVSAQIIPVEQPVEVVEETKKEEELAQVSVE